jgi:alkaline phosphatase
VRIGILGAARIAPMALIRPSRQVEGARVVAVAARDAERARAFARKHRIPRVHPSYIQEATIPLRYGTHGGEDVTIHAGGPGAALFDGVQEQHFIYHAMVEALGWNRTVGKSE